MKERKRRNEKEKLLLFSIKRWDGNQYSSSGKHDCNCLREDTGRKKKKGKREERKNNERRRGKRKEDSVNDILRLSISGHWGSQGYYILLNIIFQPMNRNPFLSLGQRELNYM